MAEGFLEDAKYAGEVDPELLRQAHMDMTDQDEKRMTERILEVVRGDARRRKATRENDDWIPNRGARERLQHAGFRERGGADGSAGKDDEEEMPLEEEEEQARIAAVLAKERLERLRFIQQARELQQQAASSGDEEDDARQPTRPAPLVRKTSCAVPSLAEFGSKFAGGGLVRSVSGGGPPATRVALKRGSSLLGSGAPPQPAAQQQQPGALSTGKVFFFDTKQRGTDPAGEAANSPEAGSASALETPAVRP